MTIFAGFLLGALWSVTAGLFGYSLCNGKEGPALLSALMGTALFLVTIGFLNHLTG